MSEFILSYFGWLRNPATKRNRQTLQFI